MLHLLKSKELLSYSDVHIYCSTLYQPAYEHLKEYFQKLEHFIKSKSGEDIKIIHFYDVEDEILNPSLLNKDQHHIIIFDDVMLNDQKIVREYFCKGHHNNVSVFYLCQSLFKIAKHCIRDNANIFILFRQDDKTLKYFHETHISGDMNFEELKKFCNESWTKHGFVVFNIWEDAYCGRYLSNYKKIYIPKKYL
jgi:hypothetical protein